MTHDEYLERLETFHDNDAVRVLSHTEVCRLCRREARSAERKLRTLLPEARSTAEEIARSLVAASVLLLVVLGVRSLGTEPESTVRRQARYRIVGDSSGVVGYTPSGIVVGIGEPTRDSEQEVSR